MRGVQVDESHRKPGVLSVNWNTVAVFLGLSTQWTRVGAIGAFEGIGADRIQATLALSGRQLDPEEFEGLKLMEAVAKPLLNEALRER